MSILSRLLLERRLGTDRRRSLRDTPERRGSNRIRYFVAARNGVVIGERSGRTVFTHVVIGSDGDAYLATFHRSREHAEACKSHVFPASTGPRIVAAIETVREMKIGERLREGDMLHPQSSVASH